MSTVAAQAVVVGRHRAEQPQRPALRQGALAGRVADAPGQDARPGGEQGAAGGERPGRGWGRRVVSLVTSLVLLVCAVAFCFLAVGPHLLGYRTSTMLTGSMEPGIMPGDVVVTTPQPAADVAVGDVITYQIPVEDHRVETHRVVEVIHGEDGSVAVRTKGDNNENADPWVATLEGDIVYEMQAVVPKLGSAIRALRSPAVQDGVRWVALAGALLLGFSLIWSPAEDGDQDEDTAGDEA
ncbi:signal peptidase I [Nocardioides sp. NPDC092400]|uniref:signal peptidase I n=1 Tax=Nocardioides sp. NPDC092400 TaxID=3155196 RepID=UPI003426D11F